jgi:GTP cyclohydrolase I
MMNFHSRDLNLARLCNEALDQPLTEAEREAMMMAAAQKVEELFDILRIDHRNDHNTRETPQRVAKMYVEEILAGRYSARRRSPSSTTLRLMISSSSPGRLSCAPCAPTI